MLAKHPYTNNYVEYLTSEECSNYLRKFRGTLIFRGKSSLSYRWFDKIRLYYKNYFFIDVDFPIRKSILQIMPVVGISNIKKGRRVQKVPILLKQQKRYALINDWIIRKQRGTTNVRGVKIKSIGEEIMKCFFLKSKAKVIKDDYTKEALKARYILMQRGKKRFSPGFNSFRKKIYEKALMKENKYIIHRKRKKVSDIKRVIDAFFFLDYKKSNWFMKRKSKSLRNFMLETWDNLPVDKIRALGKWANANKVKPGRRKKKSMGLVTINNIVRQYEKKREN